MTTLTRIGNSQGIRIPKPLIQQARLENVPLDLQVVANGILIKPIYKPSRDTWKENIESVLNRHQSRHDEALLDDMLDDSDLDNEPW